MLSEIGGVFSGALVVQVITDVYDALADYSWQQFPVTLVTIQYSEDCIQFIHNVSDIGTFLQTQHQNNITRPKTTPTNGGWGEQKTTLKSLQ